MIAGDYAGAAAAFVDYWCGVGKWAALRPTVQAALIRWAPKALLDFRALIEEPTPPAAYCDLRMPVLYAGRVCAETDAPHCSDLGEIVASSAFGRDRRRWPYGPLTHATVANELITAHIDATRPHSKRRKAAHMLYLAPRPFDNSISTEGC